MKTKSNKANVLLVDDHRENLVVLKATLSSLDVNLVEARSGKEALKQLLEEEFAVILLDVMMPEMDGFETAQLIREREKSKHTPIIFVTAMYLADQDAFKGYSVGAVDYIMKPFSPQVVRSKVAVFVDLFKKTEEVKRQAQLIREMEQREFVSKLQATEERMRQETERERSESLAIRAVLEHAPVGYAKLDKDHKIIETNHIFKEQFLLFDDFSAKTIAEALPSLPQSVHQAISFCTPLWLHDLRVEPGKGVESTRYYDLAVLPVTSGGQLNSTILVATDVTERILRDLQRKDFVSTLAHDLQTPIIASDRALSLLKNKLLNPQSEDAAKLVTMLKKNNENLLHMIESLTDVYHYEEGATALYFDDVDLKLLATTCIDELLPLIEEQGLAIKSSFAKNLNHVVGDRTAIRRVITNLLDNSIKFTPRAGTISVQARNAGEFVVFAVTDTGIGIKPEDKSHLFERYWHGSEHKSYKRSSGLGLYLCRQIVESHGGRIECESVVNKMTTFRFSLPGKEQKETAFLKAKHLQESAI